MEVKELEIEKNVKDLEYNKLLNLITTYIAIMATFVISIALAESIDIFVRIIIIVSISSTLIYKIDELYKELDNKLREIRELKNK